MEIYISGVHSDPNPSAGLGIARSLRDAYSDSFLVAVDYSSLSSGLHSSQFDDVWIQRPWDELNLTLYSEQINERLESGAYWISGLDIEILWLSQVIGNHPNLLIPSRRALPMIAKPDITAHEELPLNVPPFLSILAPDGDIHEFCRVHDWSVWLKGPYHDACKVSSWEDFKAERLVLSEKWSSDRLFLQAHVLGYEESIALSAYQGMLLDCVYISKRSATPEGKTWAARVTEVPQEIFAPLRNVIEQLSWTGGAELEVIRDVDDNLWLIDWNPRFPAWIHGATIAGHNLPALLVKEATGHQPAMTLSGPQEFIRIVQEIPCREDFPLPPLPFPSPESVDLLSKHPSTMPKLAQQLRSLSHQSVQTRPELPDELAEEIHALVDPGLSTPARLQLQRAAVDKFRCFAIMACQASSANVKVQVAYSIKTSPDKWLLETALQSGMLAEAISQLEVASALSTGFSIDKIVLNGPGKWWPEKSHKVADFGFVFADSIEELRTYSSLPLDRIGIRLRLPFVNSRFGVSLAPYESFRQLVSVVRDFEPGCAFGLHFHLPSCVIGIRQWWHLYDSFVGWARAIESATNREVCCLNIGGGWFPDDAICALLPNLKEAVAKAEQAMPNLRFFYLEPGRALTQATSILAVRILEVRHVCTDQAEIVVDGAVSDLPMIKSFPHSILGRDELGKWRLLHRGGDRILGRSCMENDILASGIGLPENAKANDILVICDAGAYDRSMSYEFGRG